MPSLLCGRAPLAALAGLILLVAGHAGADEPRFPNISIEVSTFEVEGDVTYASDDAAADNRDVFATIEPAIKVALTPSLSLNALAVLEPVRDAAPNDDRVFEDHGLYLEELHLDYETERASFAVGKLTPNFGKAWDVAPGVFGTDFAEGYELSERVGLAGAFAFGDKRWGRHRAGAGAFFLDTALNHSLITSRGTIGRADGGPSNTERLNSWSLFVEGEVTPVSGLSYHLAFVDQAKGRGGGGDERGFAAALVGEFDLGGGWSLAPLVELVHFENADTVRHRERTFVTAAAELAHGGWRPSFMTTRRITDVPDAGTENDEDSLYAVSLGYAFDNGVGVALGWKRSTEARVESKTVGLLLSYPLGFGPWPR